ncbi:6-phosphogluconolactonase [Streptomyces zingiberis]|uniref:6-phosphogluconolactonase n=1 Tax=Streptomyces zingiberis TaxID=2053010 RepID=A0ABX1C0Q3_9ACTN|nr:6-phosphogluconolactonase [Streptomyces zingiberis]NJQ02163.1 6-phosphogluconolactonase [Streptomyces zingiberis]
MTAPRILVHRDTELMARATAARLVRALADAQTARGTASVVLTGGRNGNALLAALAASPDRDAVDWARLDVWWGDERFLPGGDPDRNEVQAREALLDAVGVDPARVHPMPAADGPHGAGESGGADGGAGDGGDGTEAAVAGAAEAYARELAEAAGAADEHGPAAVPAFDVLLLGVGPDTHVASLFPELSAVRETERTVVGVHGAPKPPPVRISLTLPAIRAAREVWLLAAGEDKAGAVARALTATGEIQVPAAGARGTERTLWLLDRAAAARLPEGVTAEEAAPEDAAASPPGSG